MTLVNNRVENLKLLSKNFKTAEEPHGHLINDDAFDKNQIFMKRKKYQDF